MKGVGLTAALACLAFTHASAATVTLSVEKSKGACRVISLPRWSGLEYPRMMLNSSGPRWPDPAAYNRPGLLFRTTGRLVLVGLVAVIANAEMFPQKVNPAVHPDRFAIDLERSTMRLATDEEWRSSAPLHQPKWQMETRFKEFRGIEAARPPFEPGGAQISEDGRYMADSQWKGRFGPSCADFCFPPIFHRPYGGVFFVNAYDKSGAIKFSMEGRIHGDIDYLNELFQRPGWLSSRYYLFPLDESAWNEFALCDVERRASVPGDSRVISLNGPLPKHASAEMVASPPPSAKINSVTDKALLDAAGQLRAIRVTVSTNVSAPGIHLLGMDLVASNGKSVTKRISDLFIAGPGQWNLDFDLDTLRRLQADGPFTEAHLYLRRPGDELPAAPADYIEKVGMTRTYTIPPFPLQMTGEFLAKGVITGSGPKFDVLRAEIGISSTTATTCSVYGHLWDRANHAVDYERSAPGAVGPGAGTLTLDFNGIRVAQSSGGPYRILADLRCTKSASQANKILTVDGFAPEQFRYEEPDFQVSATGPPPSGIAGAAMVFSLLVSTSGAFGASSDSVSFSAGDVPAGATMKFQSLSILGAGSNQLTVHASDTILPGRYTFSVVCTGETFRGRKIVRTLPLVFTITPGPR
jgi:hypothetical protein